MLIIISIIVVGVLLTLVFTRFSSDKQREDEPMPALTNNNVECCGTHDVCEKETLLSENDKIIYYQDEELDIFRFKEPQTYCPKEIEQFREVLYTMNDDEVAGWLRSLQLRGIYLPYIVREEALMIVAEVRESIGNQRENNSY